MRELFLHIGMHKTGTTAIQRTLFAHRRALQAAGYSYFDVGANHSRTIFSAFTARPHRYSLNRRRGLHGIEDAAAFATTCREQLEGFLADAPGPALLLSGEGVTQLSEAAIRRMLGVFRRPVDRITVIGFVRPPRSYIASALQQVVKGGKTLEQSRDTVEPRYRKRFAPFLDAPEVAALVLRPYVPDRLEQGCSVATLLRLIGAPDRLYGEMKVERANSSMSRLGAVLSLAANEAVPVFGPDGAPNPDRAQAFGRFLETLEGERFVPPTAMMEAILERSAPDIAWMESVLGERFADSEKQPGTEARDLCSLDWDEMKTLVRAINDLLVQPGAKALVAPRERDSAGRRRSRAAIGSEADGAALAAPPGGADRAARRAARIAARRSARERQR